MTITCLFSSATHKCFQGARVLWVCQCKLFFVNDCVFVCVLPPGFHCSRLVLLLFSPLQEPSFHWISGNVTQQVHAAHTHTQTHTCSCTLSVTLKTTNLIVLFLCSFSFIKCHRAATHWRHLAPQDTRGVLKQRMKEMRSDKFNEEH